MMGGMGGMSGAGGGAGSGRDAGRNAWLVEEEDAWGTEVVASAGVIGRGQPAAAQWRTERQEEGTGGRA